MYNNNQKLKNKYTYKRNLIALAKNNKAKNQCL